MINGLKYKNELLEISKAGRDFGVSENNEPVSCYNLFCDSCIFNDKLKEESINCTYSRMEWLLSEHKEMKTITESEKQFCDVLLDIFAYYTKDDRDYSGLCLTRGIGGNLFFGDTCLNRKEMLNIDKLNLKFDAIGAGETYKLVNLSELPAK